MIPHHSRFLGAIGSLPFALVLFAGLLIFAETAAAQLQVGLKLDKKTYMLHEPVTGVLTLINRTGRNVVLDGKNGGSWLDFKVTDPRQQMVTPLRRYEKPKPIVLKSGVPIELKVTINSMYPMGATGMYGAQAQVFFPPIQRYFQSNRSTLNIVDGQEMWSQTVGVPRGQVGAGEFRTYTLLTFLKGARERALYFRLADADTGVVRRTFSLGKLIQVRKPRYVVDSQSNLHILHLAGPSIFAYTLIDPQGDVIERTIYKEHQGKLPELVVNSVTGDVRVTGGISSEETKIPYEQREVKGISERPPGMPRL